jgi:starch-binding outer membrane protein, SusD/RagB family
MSGILHGHVAMMFDRMFVVHETRPIPEDISKATEEVPLVDYKLGRDSAIAYILEAIDTMQAKPFTIPSTWIPHRARTSQDLIRLGHSYIAQILVYSARTPQERAAVDWAKVLFHAERGLTEEFFIDLSPSTGGLGIFNNTLARAQQALTSTFSSSGDYKLIGPADVSGRYAEWLRKPLGERDWFDIVTPDRRITGATPTATGMYFRYRTSNIFNVERGTYHRGRYQSFRKYGGTSAGVWYLISLDELNLIRAEALHYLNRRPEAANLVNISRTRNRVFTTTTPFNFPGLPPVTADGVPQAADCVPRMDGVACANLLHAIQYERMIEGLLITGYRAWMDSRGWGRLPPGSFLHFPIPGRELVALGLPNYSFGGVGGEGAATCPANQIWCQ